MRRKTRSGWPRPVQPSSRPEALAMPPVGLAVRRAIMNGLYPAEGREAAVYGDYDPCDELRGVAEQPDDRADQLLRIAEPAHRGVLGDGLAAGRQGARLLIGQQEPVLLGQEEARGDGIDA